MFVVYKLLASIHYFIYVCALCAADCYPAMRVCGWGLKTRRFSHLILCIFLGLKLLATAENRNLTSEKKMFDKAVFLPPIFGWFDYLWGYGCRKEPLFVIVRIVHERNGIPLQHFEI